ncbi:MAG: hypothetical protein ACW967_09740 [Candidatus Hodarchaeales archaeon]|jgi:hypothetical protein
MSILVNKVISSTHEQILIQNILLKHNFGYLIAENILGTTPRLIAIEHLKIIPISGSPNKVLLEVYFKSDLGSFRSLLTFEEFSSVDAVNQHLLHNNWLKFRFKNNSKVKIPAILAYDEHYIISDAVQRVPFENSPLSFLNKAEIAGEILATFHSSEQHSADFTKYSNLLSKTISSLSLSKIRKEKLFSLGLTLLYDLNLLNSGVYGFGDFNTDHILIDDSKKGYLIDPEFVQFTKNVDRFEDISNFFVSTALDEFKKYYHIKNTFLALRTFFRSYNGYLRLFGTSLENIYDSENIYIAFYFHLGLNALIKSLFISESNSSQSGISNNKSNDPLMEICKFVMYIWSKGVILLPENLFPFEFIDKRINDQGWTVSWVAMGKSFFESLQNDLHFQLIYRRPKLDNNLSIKEAERHWNIKGKKTLKKIITELNSWFSEEIVTIEKDQLIYNEELIKSFDLITSLSNWEVISKSFREIYLKKPENIIIHELVNKQTIEEHDLNKILDFDKKTISDAIKNLIKEKKIIKIKNMIALNPRWEIGLAILARETLRY